MKTKTHTTDKNQCNVQYDCNGNEFPVFAVTTVLQCTVVKDTAPESCVYLLEVSLDENAPVPRAGQFYMLRSQKSARLLARPISVFHVGTCGDNKKSVQFLILKKWQGTGELCSLHEQDKVQMLGPLGNGFECFYSALQMNSTPTASKVCIVGGGIGIAPVAGFAETLVPRSYDFFASFKSGCYGLEHIKPDMLTVTTDDGSTGIKGMLSAALTLDVLKEKKYAAVFACGPEPMLCYVKKICSEANILCYLSMENRMACGVGACLGCTVETSEGYKRCCKDGPVFDAAILHFNSSQNNNLKISEQKNEVTDISAETDLSHNCPKENDTEFEIDMSVKIADVLLKNPVIAASGTFGYGSEYISVFDVNKIGAISSKGLTLEAREGNGGIRLWETPSGIINSIGLQNPGIKHFVAHELLEMLALDTATIVNLSGSTIESYVEGAGLIDNTEAPLIELNISCPNVLDGGAIWGCDCRKAESVVAAVRAATKKTLIVKLTPQAPDIAQVAIACIEAGADAISLCNTFSAVAIDIEKGLPVFKNVRAGLSGPAIRPIAVRMVYDTFSAIKKLPQEKQVPIIAGGGIATWQDAVEFIMAGATAVEVGASTFANPLAMLQIISGLEKFMRRKKYKNIYKMIGCANI